MNIFDKAADRIDELEAEKEETIRWIERIHKALENPRRPRQSVGEMVYALLNKLSNV